MAMETVLTLEVSVTAMRTITMLTVQYSVKQAAVDFQTQFAIMWVPVNVLITITLPTTAVYFATLLYVIQPTGSH
jgi:hypothetical protein